MFGGDPYGVQPYGAYTHTEIDGSAFQAFLARITAPRCWLLEIDALSLAVSGALNAGYGMGGFGDVGYGDAHDGVTGGLQTLRYGTHGWVSRLFERVKYLDLPGTDGNYASAPHLQNLLPWSEALDQWNNISAVTVTPNAYADPNGEMTMDTLTDDSAAAFEGKALTFTVPNDNKTYQVAFLVRKDFAATHRSGANIVLIGGTGVSRLCRYALDGTNAAVCTVTSFDADNWLVSATITNNTSGNTSLQVQLYGAVATTKGGGDIVTAVGSTTYGWVRVQRSAALLPYVKTAGAAVKGITGDIDIDVDCVPDVAVPATQMMIASKWNVTNDERTVVFVLDSAGKLQYRWSANGATASTKTSSVSAGLVAGQRIRLRVYHLMNNGAGGNDAAFFKSTDGGLSWSQIGTTQTTAGTTSLYDSTAAWMIGRTETGITDLGGYLPFSGDIYDLRIYSGVRESGGTLHRRCLPSSFPANGLSARMETGETWGIAQSGSPAARIVDAGIVAARDPDHAFYYDGRIKDGFTIIRDLASRDGVGGLSTVSADLALSNADGGLDGLLNDYALHGRSVRLLVGAADAAYAEFGTVFEGVVESATITDAVVRLRFSDGQAKLALPIQANTYLGTGGLEGGADLKGKPKPLCYGARFNVPPVLVDAANLIWQVHDGAIQDVSAVRDRAVALTKVVGVPAAGEYAVDVATGTFQLGAMPDGEMTCDVEGDAPAGGYSDRLAVIAQRILAGKLYTSEIDAASFANLNSLVDAPCGIWIGAETRTVVDVLDEFLFGAGCFGGFSRHGVFSVGRIAAPNEDAPVLELDEVSIKSIEREPLPGVLDPIAWSVVVGWRRNHRVQTDIAALAADADRVFATEEWRYSRAEDAGVKSRHLLAREYGPIPSPFKEQADGDAEAVRLFALWGVDRARFRVGTVIEGMLADVGQVVQLTHRRHRLANSRPARVIGQTITRSSVELRVIA